MSIYNHLTNYQDNNSQTEEFRKNVKLEYSKLKKKLENKETEDSYRHIGTEIEFIIVDKDTLHPVMKNEEFLDGINKMFLVPEVGKFDLEINTNHYEIKGNVFAKLESHINKIWQACINRGKEIGVLPVMIGTMPLSTIDETKSCLSNIPRVEVIEKNLAFQRKYKPIKIHLKGIQELDIDIESISIMSNTASFQTHFGIEFENSHRYYNAAQILSGPLLAISTNSPTLFQKELWEENRIPIFEGIGKSHRTIENQPIEFVSFGNEYVKKSILELFEENIKYPILFPINNRSESSNFFHTKLLNGNIYRWNRPIIDSTDPNSNLINLRIENRPTPSGPTIKDMIANSSFFIGVCQYLANIDIAPEKLIKFDGIKKNFYNAAQYGLNSDMIWFEEEVLSTKKLIIDKLIPMQREGLRNLKVDEKCIDELTSVIKSRTQNGITGSAWQHAYLKKVNNDYYKMFKRYIELQNSGKPVHLWEI